MSGLLKTRWKFTFKSVFNKNEKMRSICNLRYIHPHRRKDTQWLTVAGKHPHRRKDASRLTDDGINNKQHVPWKLSYPLTLRKVCFPLGNRLWRFPRSRSKPALCPPNVFFTPSSRKRKTPKQNICFIVSPLVIAFGAFQETGQSLRFARPMFSLRRFCVNANAETKHLWNKSPNFVAPWSSG